VAELTVAGSSVRVVVTLPTAVVAVADAEFFAKHLALTDESGPGMVRLLRVRPPAGGKLSTTHSTFELDYLWPRPLQALTIRYDLFPHGVPMASCLATIVRGSRVQTFVFTPQNSVLVLGHGWTRALARLGSFIALGVEHIISGYDHILFLLSLLMLGGGLRDLLKIVSAFTVAHSITLSLATLNLISLPGRWVESAIALSIVVVAAENLLRTGIPLRRRWAVTFTFGLVHGLGFASVLNDLDLPRAALVSSLVGFNLGVEVGQIAIVALAYGALRLLASRTWAPALRWWLSASAAAVGLLWFVQRAFHG
jgi:hydrogenase/urease accessory protein HupE